jgi:uncharacterized membrane protein
MAFATIDVTKGITGTIPVANGGTGLTSGTTGQFLKFTGTTTVASAAVVTGLEEADGWQVTSGFSGAANPITSNWSRNNLRSTGGKVGTGMTQSSGVFSFPSTGLYFITFIRNYYNNANAANVHANIAITSDDGSNWYTVTSSYGNTYNNGQDPSGNAHSHSQSNIYFNVTNVSTHKVRFHATHYGSISGSLDSAGGTNNNGTQVTFMKMGTAT